MSLYTVYNDHGACVLRQSGYLGLRAHGEAAVIVNFIGKLEAIDSEQRAREASCYVKTAVKLI